MISIINFLENGLKILKSLLHIIISLIVFMLFILSRDREQPPITSCRANSTEGHAPLTVSFGASSSSEPDGERIEYNRDFGNNST